MPIHLSSLRVLITDLPVFVAFFVLVRLGTWWCFASCLTLLALRRIRNETIAVLIDVLLGSLRHGGLIAACSVEPYVLDDVIKGVPSTTDWSSECN